MYIYIYITGPRNHRPNILFIFLFFTTGVASRIENTKDESPSSSLRRKHIRFIYLFYLFLFFKRYVAYRLICRYVCVQCVCVLYIYIFFCYVYGLSIKLQFLFFRVSEYFRIRARFPLFRVSKFVCAICKQDQTSLSGLFILINCLQIRDQMLAFVFVLFILYRKEIRWCLVVICFNYYLDYFLVSFFFFLKFRLIVLNSLQEQILMMYDIFIKINMIIDLFFYRLVFWRSMTKRSKYRLSHI